jgi:muramoyltetrapeptide carboxypeptidase
MRNGLVPMSLKLKKGSRVAVVSPASAARAELVERGCEHLRAFGYEPLVMPHALTRGPLYYAGTVEERLVDLHAAFTDKSIDGILCTRGGWGSAELLPLLDAALVGTNSKVFVGYSDHTSLHAWLWNECGMRTFYAPMVAADWSRQDGVDERTWRAAIQGDGVWSVDSADGLRVIREGEAEGRLLGGCISILEAGLGTPWSLRITEPCVLFLEDIGVKPYQWDRMLQHLQFAGLMKNVRGVVLGDMSACVEPSEMELLEAACRHALRDFDGPVAIGLRSGHVQGSNRTVPLGAWVRMSGAKLGELGE